MKKQLLLLALLLLPLVASAAAVEVDGIYYNLNGTEASVASKPSGLYSGNITIPSEVYYEGDWYSVTSIGDFAFSHCGGITSIVIPSSMTSIGEEAFYWCYSLTSITIPNSVTSIGYHAFKYCSGLTSIVVEEGNTVYDSRDNCKAIIETSSNTLIAGCNNAIIPSGVTSIGDAAFYGCSDLTSITIPSSVTSIGSEAFYYCTGLKSITIPSSVTSIGDYAFYDCRSLTSITIPSMTSICEGAFYNCSSLTSITIPNSVTSIGHNAFSGCSGLTSITIPSSVTFIGENAFRGSGLTSVVIPDNVVTLGGCSFAGCENLVSATIGSGVKNYNGTALIDNPRLNSIIVSSDNTVIDSRNGCNAVIGKSNNDLLTGCQSTVIPDGVGGIGYYAFRGSSGLTEIVIPASVTYVGHQAFQYCENLTSVTVLRQVPPSLSDESSFYHRANATLYVPVGCKAAYEAANIWKEFKEIKEIGELPAADNITFADANVKALCVANWDTNGDGELSYSEAAAVTDLGTVFKGNGEITSFNELQYFTGLTSIGNQAFLRTGLTSINIPGNVTSIGNEAFWDSYGMTFVEISNGVTSIGDFAFSHCGGITSIVIPSSVTSIGEGAFVACVSLSSITVESGNTVYDSRNNCNAIIETNSNTLITGCKNAIIPSSVTSIANYAFCQCPDLTSVTIPSNVTSIGNHAFFECTSLTSITIPSGVTSIGDLAFSRCSGLGSIIVEAGNPSYDSRNNCNAIIETNNDKLIIGCESTIIPTGVKTIGISAFEFCSGLTSISVPNSVTSIESSAFRGCSGLTSFIIPSSVTSISNEMLRGCTGLTSIEIPSTVTSIGGWAFAECNLSSVTVKHSTPISIAGEPFDRTDITLYVPAGCKAAYEADDYWKDFKEIKEIGEVETMATVTIGAAGMATYSNSRALDFTDVKGLKAYVASGFNTETFEQTLTRVRNVPAGEGLLLKGAKGTYQVPYKKTSTFYANLLVGLPTATTVNPTDGNKTNFILANDAVKGVGFYPLSKPGTIGPNKAYLQLPTAALTSEARAIRLIFENEEEEVTSISDAARLNEKEEMRNEKFFDLQGRRVTKPTRGLYVKDGKKVFVK